MLIIINLCVTAIYIYYIIYAVYYVNMFTLVRAEDFQHVYISEIKIRLYILVYAVKSDIFFLGGDLSITIIRIHRSSVFQNNNIKNILYKYIIIRFYSKYFKTLRVNACFF